ncbi:MAG TPA: ABC transporter permease [Actinomycetes bacterium]|jgi:peptide/nickel transport system permease protein|nr:ABC transporter permease [Actinomycetota bacterium]HEX2155527.1 ABC transporter permease [Actinomycetes bacterium]
MATAASRSLTLSAGQRRLGAKLVGAVLSLAFVLVFNFFLFRVLPGDPAKNLTRNRLVPAEQVQVLRESFGLGRPLPQQFVSYVGDTLTGDLGISYKFRRPVSEVIAERIWPTVLLLGLSTVLSTVIGLWIGIRGAWRRGSVFDRVSLGASLALYAMPEFWLGILLLILFGVGVGGFPGLFPTGGLSSPNTELASLAGIVDVARHLFLPCLTLTLAYIAEYALVMRSSLLDELGQDYLTTARAKGLRDALVLRRHAVPNALLPTTTLIFLNLGFVVSGAITIETVYSWPGLGLLSYEALRTPDYPLLQGVFLLFSAAVILANVVADLLYAYLDPRVRTG